MDVQIKQRVQTTLECDGFWRYVNEAANQFLQPSHPFCHFVLKDASQQERIRDQMREVEKELMRS